mmetsp:Transcript_12817/g.50056  ORF Transcript_12817/g.50056 Transcript_12817/m.50056 type:complete len:230 (+) Transcript_12817:994-1683(+)
MKTTTFVTLSASKRLNPPPRRLGSSTRVERLVDDVPVDPPRQPVPAVTRILHEHRAEKLDQRVTPPWPPLPSPGAVRRGSRRLQKSRNLLWSHVPRSLHRVRPHRLQLALHLRHGVHHDVPIQPAGEIEIHLVRLRRRRLSHERVLLVQLPLDDVGKVLDGEVRVLVVRRRRERLAADRDKVGRGEAVDRHALVRTVHRPHGSFARAPEPSRGLVGAPQQVMALRENVV